MVLCSRRQMDCMSRRRRSTADGVLTLVALEMVLLAAVLVILCWLRVQMGGCKFDN